MLSEVFWRTPAATEEPRRGEECGSENALVEHLVDHALGNAVPSVQISRFGVGNRSAALVASSPLMGSGDVRCAGRPC